MNKRTNNPSPEFNRDREFSVILEDLHTKFDILADGLKSVVEGQAITNNSLEKLELKVDGLEMKVDGLNVKVGRLEMKTDVMYKELSGQRTDIIEIKDILKRQDNRLTKIEFAKGRA